VPLEFWFASRAAITSFAKLQGAIYNLNFKVLHLIQSNTSRQLFFDFHFLLLYVSTALTAQSLTSNFPK